MKTFIDSNIVVYAFGEDPRTSVARTILSARCVISVQTLNEFTNVARRKLRMEWGEITEALSLVRRLSSEIRPIELITHVAAIALAERYGFAFYDAMIVASALEARCAVLLSEDMHDGLIVNDRLTIRNPFATT